MMREGCDNMTRLKIGDKIFSPENGFLHIEGLRGKGKDREFKISIMDKEYWLPISKINR
jgi:hypothetical protein